MLKMELCNCGSKQNYEDCCELIHKNHYNAKTAAQLMRSRYCAFTKGKGDYIVASHHEETRATVNEKELSDFGNSVKWMHLQILKIEKGGIGDSEGVVEFKAHFKKGMFKKVIHEKSKFLKKDGLWYYLEAI